MSYPCCFLLPSPSSSLSPPSFYFWLPFSEQLPSTSNDGFCFTTSPEGKELSTELTPPKPGASTTLPFFPFLEDFVRATGNLMNEVETALSLCHPRRRASTRVAQCLSHCECCGSGLFSLTYSRIVVVTQKGDRILTGRYESHSQQGELQGNEERATGLRRVSSCAHGNRS